MIKVNDKGTDIKEVDVFEYICWKDNMMMLNGGRLERHWIGYPVITVVTFGIMKRLEIFLFPESWICRENMEM